MMIKRDRLKKGMAKEVILRAAESVFAQNGYDGTTVDAVARQAGVTKMLLYYHFKNKHEILMELFRMHADDIYAHIDELFPADEVFSERYLDKFVDNTLSFLKSKRDVIKIFLVEIVKENEASDDIVLLSIIQPLLNAVSQRLQKIADIQLHDNVKNDVFYIDFFQIFQSIVPIFTFYAFGDKIGRCLNHSYEDTERLFADLLKNNIKQIFFFGQRGQI